MRKFILACIVSLLSLPAFSQGVLNVRINEVLINNERDIIDGYGNHGSWIELFNTGYENVDIGGCCLAVRHADRYDSFGNKLIVQYSIPISDKATAMGPREYRLFFCEGTDTKGTFYTNFTLVPDSLDGGNVDMIILYKTNAKDVISVFRLPEDHAPNVSWGLTGDKVPESFIFPKISREERRQWEKDGIPPYGDHYLDELAERQVHQPQEFDRATPGTTNETTKIVSRDKKFVEKDRSGLVMTAIAMSVVFLALVLIFLIIKIFGMVMMSRSTRREASSKGVPKQEAKMAVVSSNAEEIAAIGLALRMFQDDFHVKESAVITINRVGRIYSPWSSKIHGLRQMPVKKG